MRHDAEFKVMLGALSPVEIDALKSSIEDDGVREPITLWSQYECKECGEVSAIHQLVRHRNQSDDGIWYCSNCGHELEDEEFASALADAVVVDGYAAAFLASVLKSIKPVINTVYNIGAADAADAENTAFFMKLIFCAIHFILLRKYDKRIPYLLRWHPLSFEGVRQIAFLLLPDPVQPVSVLPGELHSPLRQQLLLLQEHL